MNVPLIGRKNGERRARGKEESCDGFFLLIF